MKFLKIIVVCPVDPHNKYNLTIPYLMDSHGVCIHSPVQGCDFFNGSETCVKCSASLNSILFKNQELYLFGANTTINPNFQ